MEEGTSTEELPPSDCLVSRAVQCFLTVDWGGRVWCTMDVVILWAGSPGRCKKELDVRLETPFLFQTGFLACFLSQQQTGN